jgi:hypothetical protein
MSSLAWIALSIAAICRTLVEGTWLKMLQAPAVENDLRLVGRNVKSRHTGRQKSLLRDVRPKGGCRVALCFIAPRSY